MNCESFQIIAGDLARDEIIEATERARALAHIDECRRCGQQWNDQRELSEKLRMVAGQMSLLQAPAHLEGQLRAAFRDRAKVRPIHSAPRRWLYWTGAVAAALLIAFAVIGWRARVASRPQLEVRSNIGSPSESPPPGPSSVQATAKDGARNPLTPIQKNLPRPRRARSQPARLGAAADTTNQTEAVNAPAANTETKEVTTDFVALGYGNTLDLQDGGQLVRVELPRSALARFGLPVNMNRVDERVKADVLFGTDGLARAIRFVK